MSARHVRNGRPARARLPVSAHDGAGFLFERIEVPDKPSGADDDGYSPPPQFSIVKGSDCATAPLSSARTRSVHTAGVLSHAERPSHS